jgi:hypothetical protein
MLFFIRKAIKEFEKHNGLLKTAEALRCGIQPRTLYAMLNQKSTVAKFYF